ncbi:MAG: chemotaxis protein CheR [Opitutae bacterium]|nr:chemotaxis protein CheR [Opitutae bacterium]
MISPSAMDPGTLTHQQFVDFGTVINSRLGIKMPPSKQVMLQSRLQRRVRELGLASIHDYHTRFFSDEGAQEEELEHLLNLATTNKTDFFREPDHFHYLACRVLPAWLKDRPSPTLQVWCAGCSTGEEAYTLALTLLEQQERQDFQFDILATDVSTRVLHIAREAIYTEEQARPITPALKSRYLLRSTDPKARQVRMGPEVRQRVRFGHLNFLAESYGIPVTLDVIFFRNVMIYFDRDTQREVVSRMCRHLRVGGHLFIAHAETLQGMGLPLRSVGPSIYRHDPTAAQK